MGLAHSVSPVHVRHLRITTSSLLAVVASLEGVLDHQWAGLQSTGRTGVASTEGMGTPVSVFCELAPQEAASHAYKGVGGPGPCPLP